MNCLLLFVVVVTVAAVVVAIGVAENGCSSSRSFSRVRRCSFLPPAPAPREIKMTTIRFEVPLPEFVGQLGQLPLVPELLTAYTTVCSTEPHILLAGVAAVLVPLVTAWFFGAFTQEIKQFKLSAPGEAVASNTGEVLAEPSIFVPGNPRLIQCYDPATGRSLGQAAADTPEQVDAKVRAARAAQPAWASTTFEQRRAVLRTMLRFVLDNQETIARMMARDTGKPLVDASFGEVLVICEKIVWLLNYGEKALQTEYREAGALLMHKIARVEYHPLGVQAALVSWNYPFQNFLSPVVAALFAGNAIVVKASEYVAWSIPFILSVAQQSLAVNGHSPDLVQAVVGFADAGEALVRNPLVDHITFIGSVEVGRKIMASAADTLTPCVLELGGKDVAIVTEDYNLNQLVPMAIRGTFQHCGQNCIGLERLIVHRKVYDRVVAMLSDVVGQLRQGPPLDGAENGQIYDVGAMTMGKRHMDKLQTLVDDAVSRGARLLHGGTPFKHPQYPSGTYYTPTLLVDVDADMLISREEQFGPICVVIPFDTDAEAVAIANKAGFGLGSSVFCRDIPRAERILKGVRAGMGNINDFASNYMCQSLPFGGVGLSGYGRFAGYEGLRGISLMKSVTVDRFSRLLSTSLPPLLTLPFKAPKASVAFCGNTVRFAYELTLWSKVKAVFGLLGNMLSNE
ncbi:Aldedh-domain-containing protein [Ramicandelaber brevisporus]|nr:Aldedh-domain-containing protein [Ramicandelaber brevisporus]